MYPILFHVFGYPVSSFGLMLALAFLVGAWIVQKRMPEEGIDPELVSTMLLWGMFGGILGSKLYYAVDVSLRGQLPFSAAFFSRSGITFYGGLILGAVVSIVACRIHGIPVKAYSACVAVCLAVGQAIGRLGCFLVGDDYGRASDLPWAVSFPEGSPPTTQTVHPTQLYEVLWLLPVAGLLWVRRKRSPFLFGEYLALNGVGRFAIETWRVNPKVALGLTEPQWIAIGLMLSGVGGWLYFWRREAPVEATA
jgi:phosphatidylglycerol:prolipoprotein diacylglycerol transferase